MVKGYFKIIMQFQHLYIRKKKYLRLYKSINDILKEYLKIVMRF